MQNGIDWGRVESFIFKEAKAKKKPEKFKPVLEGLQLVAEKSGEFSSNRKMLVKIAKVLFEDCPTVIAPCCPDYSHEDGRYTFKSVSGGISLLAQKQISFLESVCSALSDVRVILLMADHEADSADICRAVHVSRQEFFSLINRSQEAVHAAVAQKGWQVMAMTAMFPELVRREKEVSQWIGSQQEFQYRLGLDTINRSDMYWKINPHYTKEEMFQRTVEVAAQYVALGHYAAEHHFLVCNHTTVNLSWYLQTEAAVLHNPVSIY